MIVNAVNFGTIYPRKSFLYRGLDPNFAIKEKPVMLKGNNINGAFFGI